MNGALNALNAQGYGSHQPRPRPSAVTDNEIRILRPTPAEPLRAQGQASWMRFARESPSAQDLNSASGGSDARGLEFLD